MFSQITTNKNSPKSNISSNTSQFPVLTHRSAQYLIGSSFAIFSSFLLCTLEISLLTPVVNPWTDDPSSLRAAESSLNKSAPNNPSSKSKSGGRVGSVFDHWRCLASHFWSVSCLWRRRWSSPSILCPREQRIRLRIISDVLTIRASHRMNQWHTSTYISAMWSSRFNVILCRLFIWDDTNASAVENADATAKSGNREDAVIVLLEWVLVLRKTWWFLVLQYHGVSPFPRSLGSFCCLPSVTHQSRSGENL